MDLGDLFKDLVWDNLVKAALSRLFVVVPLLGWGPIGFVVTWFATRFANQIYESVKMAIQLEAISLRNESYKRAFDAAHAKLAVIAYKKGIHSPEFRQARDESKKALSQFAQFNR